MITERFANDNVAAWPMKDTQKYYKALLENEIRNKSILLDDVPQCICGSDTHEVVSEKDRFGLNFQTLICTKCGLMRTSPRIAESSMNYFYNNIYWGLIVEKKASNNNLMTGDSILELRMDFLEPYLTDNMTIIEIGCGSGKNLFKIKSILSKKGFTCEVYGCDYSRECVEEAKRQFDITVLQGDVNDLVKNGYKADFVILSHVLEHFTNPIETLGVIKELLKEDGMLYVEVPGVRSLSQSGLYDYDLLKYLVFAHTYHFSLQTLKNVMDIAGFHCIYGDEFVHGIFKIDCSKDRNYIELVNDYEGIMHDIKALESRYNDYQSILKMYNDGDFQGVINTQGNTQYVEILFYLYKSYVNTNQFKEGLSQIFRYVESILEFKKKRSFELLKRETKDTFLLCATMNLMKLLSIDVTLDKYRERFVQIVRQDRLMRNAIFDHLLQKMIDNEHEEIIKYEWLDLLEVHFALAKAFKICNDDEKALYYFRKYLESEGSYEWDSELRVCSLDFVISAYFHMGELSLKSAKREDAKAYFKKCIKLSNGSHIKARDYLDNIKEESV